MSEPKSEPEAKPKVIAKIEYFFDIDPECPSAFERFRESILQRDHSQFKTVILDSFTSGLRAARWSEQFIHLAGAKGHAQMKWWGESGDKLERAIAGPFKHMTTNVVIIGHIGTKPDNLRGTLVYGLEASGRLSHGLPRDFGEVYVADIDEDTEGNEFYSIQTAKSNKLMAKSHLGLPSPLVIPYGTGYETLIKECQKPQLIVDNHLSIPLKVLIYGDSGSGKSVFAASFPQPIMVYCFDGYDNAIPYLELGRPSELREIEDNLEGDPLQAKTTFHTVYALEEAA